MLSFFSKEQGHMLLFFRKTRTRVQAGKAGEYGDLWRAVAAAVGTGRTYYQCYERWRDTMRPGLQKGAGFWNDEKDSKLVALVQQHGAKAWKNKIAEHFPGATARQCRRRFFNNLQSSRKDTAEKWTQEEERQFRALRAREGNRWAKISSLMGGTRSELDCKNKYWSGVQKRKRLAAKGGEMARKAAASADSTLTLGHPV